MLTLEKHHTFADPAISDFFLPIGWNYAVRTDVIAHSKSYLALNQMIEQGWLVSGISDFDHVLKQLEQGGHITPEERRSLLQGFEAKKLEAVAKTNLRC